MAVSRTVFVGVVTLLCLTQVSGVNFVIFDKKIFHWNERYVICCIRCGLDEERILDVVPREDGARNSG
jgi:hypothetical protein